MTSRFVWAVIALAVLTSEALAAQSSPRFGFKAGMNASRFYGDAIGSSEEMESLVFGLFAEFEVGGRFSFQPEISYSKRGAREEDLLDAATEGAWRYDYFDVAPLLRYRVNSRGSKPMLSFFGGPVLSILGSSKATGLQAPRLFAECEGCERKLTTLPFVRLIQGNTNGQDFGGTIGVSVDVPLGASDVVVDVRYTRMMREVDQAPFDEMYSRKHSLLSVQLGLSLGPAAWGRGRFGRLAPVDDPDRHSIVTLDVVNRQDIAARDETLPVFNIIRLERPHWLDGDEVDATLFVDGSPWPGPTDILRDRRGFEVEEILRMEGAPGAYKDFGVVVEIITRGGPWR